MTLIPALRQRDTIDDEHWRACVHEAAHSVIGRVLGFRCGDVVAHTDGSGSSQTLAADFRAPAAAVHCARLVIAAAGPEAEILFFGDSQGHGGDLQNIDSIMKRIGQDDVRDDLFESAKSRAHMLVRYHAPTIAKVAMALLDRGRLSDAEVRAACRI